MKEMEQKNLKAAELQEQDLEKVAGGRMLLNDYHNDDEYTFAGIERISNWWKDEFRYAGKTISSDTASALVFYNRAKGLTGDVSDIDAALDYKSSHGSQYESDVYNANRD